MNERKPRNKKCVDEAQERNRTPLDDRKRFGASAFFDMRTESGDEEEMVLSLDSLREAFTALDPEQRDLATEETEFPPADNDAEAEPEAVDDRTDFADSADVDKDEFLDLSPKTILEAMLFVGDRENRPLTPERASERMRNVTPEEIDAAVVELNQDYETLGCPYHIIRDSDGYRMVLRPEFETIRGKFYGKVREATLSQQAIDTLAVIAYRQPISADEVQNWRKESCVNVLSQLVRRGLLHVEREVRDKKRIMVYRTTDRFLELFNLESLDDLPISEELD